MFTPANTYHITKEAPSFPDEQKDMVTYFVTHQPGEWMYNEKTRGKFVEIWGKEALQTLDDTGLIPVCNYPECVGGTFWDTKPDRPIYGGPVPEPPVDHTGMIQVNSPVGPIWIDPKWRKFSDLSLTEIFDNFRQIVREEIARAK